MRHPRGHHCGPRPSFYVENAVNSSVLARSQYCSFGVKSRPRDAPKWPFRTLFRLLGSPVGSFWRPSVLPKPIRKAFEKTSKFRRFLGSPGGCMPRPPATSPGSIKRTFSAKVAISLQRGANFRFLDFGVPLEKSLSVTFSEQWLCHFSIPVDDPVGLHSRTARCHGPPHATHVHRGTVVDTYTYAYSHIQMQINRLYMSLAERAGGSTGCS